MSRLTGRYSRQVLYAALALFLLSLVAPFAWHDQGPVADRGSAPGLPAPQASPANEPVVEIATSLPPEVAPEIPVSEIPTPLVEVVQPQVAPIGPLVADNIDLDPSIRETPSLPVRSPAPLPDLADPGSGLPNLPSSPDATLPQSAEPQLNPEPLVVKRLPTPPDELAASKAWPYPAGLIEQLNILAATLPEVAQWAERTKAEAEHLAHLESFAAPAARESLSRLSGLADEAKQIARTLGTEENRSKMLRAGYAIVRRLAIWEQVHAVATTSNTELAPIVDRAAWEHALAEIESRLQATGAAANWRKYLMIDEARERFDSPACSGVEQRELARDILFRLHSTQLSADQAEFLQTEPFLSFDKQLQSRASQMPDLVALLDSIERYEHDKLSAQAEALANQYDELRWSTTPGVAELAELVNTYYRNGNVRVALSAELINRMLPKEQAQYEPVQDVILGADVSGDSHTNTKLRLVLLPDRRKWRLGLEANGSVSSVTASSKGPATFYQDGVSFFRARKQLTVDRRGIRLGSAEAEANVNNNLNDFETSFDGIPLFGSLVRSFARSQYDSSQPAARSEVEWKIIDRASSQLDREVAERLEKGKQDFQAKLIVPFQKLHLDPTAVEMETTTERLIARYRIAGRDQVSAHTPRPQAPGDSLLSVQIHETAMNNVLDHLGLAGRRIELHELYKEMTSRFNATSATAPIEIPEDLPEDTYVTFADEDPVRIDCQDGRVRLTIRLAELSHGSKSKWQNFTVRGYYAPTADQLDANLARDGIIELIGDRLRFGDQIALRAIFSRVLSRNRKLNLVNEQISKSPALKDQQVTQFVIHDGWIGVALGPKTPGREALLHPRPAGETRTE